MEISQARIDANRENARRRSGRRLEKGPSGEFLTFHFTPPFLRLILRALRSRARRYDWMQQVTCAASRRMRRPHASRRPPSAGFSA